MPNWLRTNSTMSCEVGPAGLSTSSAPSNGSNFSIREDCGGRPANCETKRPLTRLSQEPASRRESKCYGVRRLVGEQGRVQRPTSRIEDNTFDGVTTIADGTLGLEGSHVVLGG